MFYEEKHTTSYNSSGKPKQRVIIDLEGNGLCGWGIFMNGQGFVVLTNIPCCRRLRCTHSSESGGPNTAHSRRFNVGGCALIYFKYFLVVEGSFLSCMYHVFFYYVCGQFFIISFICVLHTNI